MASQAVYQTFRGELTPILQLFQKIAEERKLLNLSYEATITLIPKLDQAVSREWGVRTHHAPWAVGGRVEARAAVLPRCSAEMARAQRWQPRVQWGRPLIPGDRHCWSPTGGRPCAGSGKWGRSGKGEEGRVSQGENTRKAMCRWLWGAISFRRHAGLVWRSSLVNSFQKKEEYLFLGVEGACTWGPKLRCIGVYRI